jgi:NADH-quinone oxidoreductase subunit L
VKLVENAESMMWPFVGLAVAAFVAGVGAAYWVYIQRQGEPAKQFTESFPTLHQLAVDKWRVDEIYDEVVVGSADSLAELSKAGDKWVVDGILARLTAFLVAGAGTLLRYLQNGRVQAYAAFMVLGVGGISWLLLVPRAQARTISDHAAGAYSVNAAPGLGYKYRWDANGDGEWDSEAFGETAEVKLNLDVDAERKVRLEVMNAFGRTDSTEILLVRPKPDRSSAAGIQQTMEELDRQGILRHEGNREKPMFGNGKPGAPDPHEGHNHPPGEHH